MHRGGLDKKAFYYNPFDAQESLNSRNYLHPSKETHNTFEESIEGQHELMNLHIQTNDDDLEIDHANVETSMNDPMLAEEQSICMKDGYGIIQESALTMQTSMDLIDATDFDEFGPPIKVNMNHQQNISTISGTALQQMELST